MEDLQLEAENKTTVNNTAIKRQRNDNEARETDQIKTVTKTNNNKPSLATDGHNAENDDHDNVSILHDHLFYASHQSITTRNGSTKSDGKSSNTRKHIRRRALNYPNYTTEDIHSESFHQNGNHQQSRSSDNGNRRIANNQSGYFSSPNLCLVIIVICMTILLLLLLVLVMYQYSALSANEKFKAENEKKQSARDALIVKLSIENEKYKAENEKKQSARDALIDKLSIENKKYKAENEKKQSARDALIDKLSIENEKYKADNDKKQSLIHDIEIKLVKLGSKLENKNELCVRGVYR